MVAIGNSAPRKDAIEVIEDLKVGEFYKLVKCTIQWSSRLNDKRDIMFAPAPKGSKLRKEFDSIYERRIAYNERLIELNGDKVSMPRNNNEANLSTTMGEQPKSGVVKYETNVVGTTRIVYIRGRQSIIIRKIKHQSDKYNKINSVCVSNEVRDEFYKDVKSKKHKPSHFEIRQADNEELFNKWLSIIKNTFEDGLKENGIETAKDAIVDKVEMEAMGK